MIDPCLIGLPCDRKNVVYEGFWWINELEKKPYFITRTSVTDPGVVCQCCHLKRQLKAGREAATEQTDPL